MAWNEGSKKDGSRRIHPILPSLAKALHGPCHDEAVEPSWVGRDGTSTSLDALCHWKDWPRLWPRSQRGQDQGSAARTAGRKNSASEERWLGSPRGCRRSGFQPLQYVRKCRWSAASQIKKPAADLGPSFRKIHIVLLKSAKRSVRSQAMYDPFKNSNGGRTCQTVERKGLESNVRGHQVANHPERSLGNLKACFCVKLKLKSSKPLVL
jgi:hypothetical protein